jgi:hypothetical protein
VARVASPDVRFERADVFHWRPQRRFDTVFSAFWLSHVPPSRLGDFWNTVAAEVRRLDDGSRYRIVKVFHGPVELTGTLGTLGWSADIGPREEFIVGIAAPRADVSG